MRLILAIVAIIQYALLAEAGAIPAPDPSVVLRPDFNMDLLDSAFEIFRNANATKKNKNFVISSLSIQTVLAMLSAGAGGTTQSQIRNILFNNDEDTYDLNTQFGLAMDSFFKEQEQGAQLANRLYLTQATNEKPSYKAIIEGTYKSSVEGFDASRPSKTANEINQWVMQQTHNQIKNLIKPSDIDALTEIILVNALYFKAKWKHPFKKLTLADEPETINWKILGKKSRLRYQEVPAMRSPQFGNFYYIDDTATTSMQYFAIPYEESAGDVFFVIAMPKLEYKDALRDFVKYLSKHSVTDYLPKLRLDTIDQEGNVWKSSRATGKALKMPMFSTETKLNLKPILESLNAADMFDPNLANFAGITDHPIYVKFFKHAAMLRVDNLGTEAAAATAAGGGSRILGFSKDFVIDQPFFYGIWRQSQFLFMGITTEFDS